MTKIRIMAGLVCVALLVLLGYLLIVKSSVQETGKAIGETAGAAAGVAAGSMEGITQGVPAGLEQGKEEGLSAEDTTAKIANEMREVEKLEVLVAGVTLSNFNQVGDMYAALYLMNANVVFTVDLAQAEIEITDTNMVITIPQPVPEIVKDQESFVKRASYQRKLFNGSAKDGFTEFINTWNNLDEVSRETLANYDALMDAARNAAVSQVTMLAGNASLTDTKITVSFAEEVTLDG